MHNKKLRSKITSGLSWPMSSPWDHYTQEGSSLLYTCQDCNKAYVGETGRTLNIRQKEHNGNTSDSAVAAHAHQEAHGIDWDNTFVLDSDESIFRNKVKHS